jgi:ABC-type branched-subunit amino acid transport system substrate-binding protein
LLTFLPADEGKDFLFRTCPSDALQGVILGKMAADEGYSTAAVFWVNNPYGEGLMKQFKESFEFRDGQVIASIPHDEAPAATYVSELSQIMEEAPDVMVALSYPGHATVYLKEFFEAGYNTTTDLLFVDGTKSADMPAALGPETLDGFLGTAPGSVTGMSLDNFETSYSNEYGERDPLPFATNFYDAIVVAGLAAATCDAQGVEITPTCIRDNLRYVANPPGTSINAGVEGIKKALGLIKDGKDINYEGAAGSVDFDKYGDVVTPIEVWRFITADPFLETLRLETTIPEK